MIQKVKVAILEDHQSIIDGYLFRLRTTPEIEVIATAYFASNLEIILRETPIDVLILDIHVPTSPDNPNPYPLLHTIPQLLQTYPKLNILVISVHNQGAIIRNVIEAGASGYILKDDYPSIQELGKIICSIATGGIFLSQQAYAQLARKMPELNSLTSRQIEILSIFGSRPDATTAEIAAELGVSHSTIRNTLGQIYIRLDVRNRAAAITKARQMGIITPPPPFIEF